jgi:glutathione synthase
LRAQFLFVNLLSDGGPALPRTRDDIVALFAEFDPARTGKVPLTTVLHVLSGVSTDTSLSLDEVREFHKTHGEIVVKPLHGNAGSAVMHIAKDGKNLAAITELFGQVWREPFMAQAFIRAVESGDKRIVLIDGEVAGAINRIPGAGEIRSNLAAGGRAVAADLTLGEREICAAIGPELKKRGLLFVGIDVIGGKWLTEINVTSPTGIVAIDAFNGTDTPALIWDVIEAKIAK